MAAARAGRVAAAALLSLPVFAVLLLISPVVAVSIGDGDVGFRASLIRTAESRNLSLAAERSRRRLSVYTSGTGTKAPVTKSQKGGKYIMQFSIGEPPLLIWAEVDTGSDLMWVKCSPCNGCNPPPSPLYDPAQSSSSGKLPCSSQLCQALGRGRIISDQCSDDPPLCGYHYAYGHSGDHSTQGVLGTETFTFGDGYVANNVSFGRSDTIDGSQFGGTAGLVGLGRGHLSLVSQLGAGRFAYCLAADPNVYSTILFGSLAALDTSAGDVSSTPLVTNPKPDRDTHYYVNLQGISVGGSRLPIKDGTFAINSDGSGGVFFDSGAIDTSLKDAAYQVVRQAITSEIQRLGYDAGDDTCFVAANQQAVAQMPPLVLHFDDGADMSLNGRNYLKTSTKGPSEVLVCMAIKSSSDSEVSIIGNIMQANFRLLHDLDSMTLSFQATDQC
uniref:Peptidase A1 domain-containing protein n=1 Tax=Oryza nivara TaxID=4536 RepID=A0A0E0FQ16_ORYNI